MRHGGGFMWGRTRSAMARHMQMAAIVELVQHRVVVVMGEPVEQPAHIFGRAAHGVTELEQRQLAVLQGFGEIGTERERAVVAGDGVLEASDLCQRVAAIVPGDGKIGFDGEDGIEGGERFVEPVHLEQQRRAIAQRFDEIGFDG